MFTSEGLVLDTHNSYHSVGVFSNGAIVQMFLCVAPFILRYCYMADIKENKTQNWNQGNNDDHDYDNQIS